MNLPPLLPRPRRIDPAPGTFVVPDRPCIAFTPEWREAALVPAGQLADDLEASGMARPEVRCGALRGDVVFRADPGLPPQGYRLAIAPNGIEIVAADPAGLYYGVQTLRQYLRGAGRPVPCATIEDAPEYAARGFYLDCARGRVPTLGSLMELVEFLAHHKINHLQLYVEHSFAFRGHADVWGGSDPLTAEEILRLDAHCARHHVELVPSLSTFGHCYTLLRSPRKQHLNELEVAAAELPFRWHDRMAHYTLDCRNPDSLALMTDWIAEFRALFRSDKFNICCDETWDLGKGRNRSAAAEVGAHRLYVDFLCQLMRAVEEAGATPMFWGDIMGHAPELLGDLPPEAIALDWDYSPELRHSIAGHLAAARRPFYICPGTQGWNRLVADAPTAWENIRRFAASGREHGAIGLLNTDWGDNGHPNLPAVSLHGICLGAAVAWNAEVGGPEEFDGAFSRIVLGDASGEAGALLRKAGAAEGKTWPDFVAMVDRAAPPDWIDAATGISNDLLKRDASAARADRETLRDAGRAWRGLAARATGPGWMWREIGCGLRLAELLQAAAALCLQFKQAGGGNGGEFFAVADDLRDAERELCGLWHARNKPSEYGFVRGVIVDLANRLDAMGAGLDPRAIAPARGGM